VKAEELKKIAKKIKNGQQLALELYDTGIYDACYLAGLIAEPAKFTVAELDKWAAGATSPSLREYTVAWVAAESAHGMDMAQKWIESADDELASIGWSTMANIVAITDDSKLDPALIKKQLATVAGKIHKSGNRTKQTMNGFVISVGTYVKDLNALAKETATKVGKVTVDMGDTACKVPAALEYIAKAESRGTVGKKKKSARCL
jgi:DNA alkylation repair enzyme